MYNINYKYKNYILFSIIKYNAVKTFKDSKCSFELMHCVSTYPMKAKDANLFTIQALKKKYDAFYYR